MEKIYDIKCYYDLSFQDRFNEVESWNGRIAVKDDGWFIGTVKDNYSSTKMDRLVCGVIIPGKGIQLFKFSSADIGCPLIFMGYDKDGEISGEFDVASYNHCQKCGIFKMSIKELNLGEESIMGVHARSLYIVDELLDSVTADFYENACDSIDELYKGLLKKIESKNSRDLDMVNYNIFKSKEDRTQDKMISLRYRSYDDDEYFD